MCSESLGSEKISYGPCAHQESCESLAAMAKFLVIRFDRTSKRETSSEPHAPVVTFLALVKFRKVPSMVLNEGLRAAHLDSRLSRGIVKVEER